MDKVLLSTTSGWISARKIHSHLDAGCILDQKVKENGRSVFKRFLKSDKEIKNELISELSYKSNSVIIRFGTTLDISCRKPIVYNNSQAIYLASCKMKAREYLRNNKIPVPTPIPNGNPKNIYPIIARKEFHERGEELYVCTSRDMYELALEAGYTFFSEIYPRTQEFRVHCAHGKILLIHEKPMPKDPLDIKECIKVFNNEDWECLYWRDFKYEICRVALDATRILGLDFAGVDVMAAPKQSNLPPAVVCEVNTAPATPYQYTQKKYAMYFNWLLKSSTKREHFNYTKIKIPSQFAWRNDELLNG